MSPRSVAKARAVLRRVFALADKWEFREGNPVARIDPPKGDKRDPIILTPEQYEALLEQCRKRDHFLYLYALVLGETGGRCDSEALWLRWEDVKLDDGFIWIDSAYKGRRTKGGKGRWVPMTARLHAAMRDHFASYRLGYDTQWVFFHRIRNRGARPGDRIKNFYRSLKKAAAEAGLPPEFRQHDLRHRRATTWIADGKSPVLVQEALGHADIATTMAYTHLAREHLRALVGDEEGPQERTASLRD